MHPVSLKYPPSLWLDFPANLEQAQQERREVSWYYVAKNAQIILGVQWQWQHQSLGDKTEVQWMAKSTLTNNVRV